MQLRDFDGYGGEDTEALSEYSFYRYRTLSSWMTSTLRGEMFTEIWIRSTGKNS
jgi:hypothetical protein